MNELTKIQPQVTEIETTLIGEMIQFPQVIDDIVGIVSHTDFYDHKNQVVFSVIHDLWSEGKSADLIMVTNRLKQMERLNEVGGAFAVTKMLEYALHPSSAKDHAQLIKQASVQRQFIMYGAEVEKTAYSASIDELLSLSNSKLDEITDGIYKSGDAASFKSIVDGTIADYYERKARAQSGEFAGIKTPLFDLTQITGGWQPSDLIIIAGRPSMGKTAFAVQCAVTAARNDFSADIYTLEMSSRQFTQRIMSCIDDINIERFRNGSLTAEEEQLMEQSINKMLKLRINLDDKSGITAEYIKAKSSANHRRGKCDLIIVDYLQLMAYDRKLNSNEGFGSITRKLKGLAKDLNVPVILLSQLNRDVEKRVNHRPGLSDLRSSGEIEQDADMVLFPYREHYYSEMEHDKGNIEIVIAKHRNGRTGAVEGRHNETITQFYDVDTRAQIHQGVQTDAPF
jgi:replicative DNA helicase